MKKKILIGLLLTITLLSACSSCPEKEGRTYYETLDLDTPEEAVTAFTDAFAEDDFFTVFLILSNHSQLIMNQRTQLHQYGHLYDINLHAEMRSSISLFSKGLGEGEHLDMGWYLFDEIMMAAREHSAFLIDLSGRVTILKVEPSESRWDENTTDVFTRVEGIDGEVVFRMVQGPSGKWRVLQVIVPGGDEEMIPWSVPSTDD